jgi:hypothetical protein
MVGWPELGCQKLSATAEKYPSMNVNRLNEPTWPTAEIAGISAAIFVSGVTSVDSGLASILSDHVPDFTTVHFEEADQVPVMLSNSLDELGQATGRAEDEGWPVPTPECLGRTERLLRKMFAVQPHPYWIYPTPNGEMVIDGGYHDVRVIVTLPHEGGAIYTYRTTETGELRAVECADSDEIPDDAMSVILARIGGGYDPA